MCASFSMMFCQSTLLRRVNFTLVVIFTHKIAYNWIYLPSTLCNPLAAEEDDDYDVISVHLLKSMELIWFCLG